MKSALMKVSIGLNLALAGVAGFELWREADLAAGAADESRVQSAPGEPAAPAPAGVLAFVTNKFDWDQLLAPDLKQYAANLRRVGCPQSTVADIIRAEAERVYPVRIAAVGGVPFWSCGPERDAAERRRAERQREIEAEKQALLESVGASPIDWDGDADDMLVGVALVNFLLGPVPAGVDVQVAACFQECDRRLDRIRDEAGRVLLPEDELTMAAERTNSIDRVKSLLTPAQFDEFACRLSAVQLMDSMKGFRGTPMEVHAIARIHAGSFGLLAYGEFKLLDRPDSTPEQEAEFRARLRSTLGEPRYLEFARATDSEFERTDAFATEQSLGSKVSFQLYEIRQLATAEGETVKGRSRVSREERIIRLRQIQDQTSAAIGELLGDDLLRAYLANAAGLWLTNLSRL